MEPIIYKIGPRLGATKIPFADGCKLQVVPMDKKLKKLVSWGSML
jgi:hypothetical protein